MPSRLSTSRAYWNLRAEQVMDRVFKDGEQTLETVQVRVDTPAPEMRTPEMPANQPTGLSWPQVCLVALGVIGVLGSGALALHWNLTQQTLERERNLALIERLRSNRPGGTATDAGNQPPVTTPAAGASGTIPPDDPPEIAMAPITTTTELDPITVPLPTTPVQILPADSPISAAPAPQPMLVGVVHSDNGGGSAIFQLGDLSLSAFPGDLIGNSGWTLRSVGDQGAVIERDGASQTLSVGGAF